MTFNLDGLDDAVVIITGRSLTFPASVRAELQGYIEELVCGEAIERWKPPVTFPINSEGLSFHFHELHFHVHSINSFGFKQHDRFTWQASPGRIVLTKEA